VAYHAQHGLHPAQLTPVPEPKVIVERVAQSPTLRLDRSKLPSFQPAPKRAEPTVEIPRAQGPRVLIALFSAVLVVFGIFIGLRLWSVKQREDAMATDPTASELVAPPAAPGGASAAVAVATQPRPPAAPAAPPTPTAPVAEQPTETAPVAAAPATTEQPSAAPPGAPSTALTARPTTTAPTAPWAAPPAPANPYLPPSTTSTSAPKSDVKRTIN
jgi:hypothetical protein